MKFLRIGALVALLAFAAAAEAQVKISDLPSATTLAGTEAVPAVQSANTVKTTPAAINTYVQGQTTSATIIGKFTGTCNGTTVLAGDGTCIATAVTTTGSFTLTYTVGYTTTPTQTVTWNKVGNIVNVAISGSANGTSNSTTTSTAAGAFPAGLRPVVRTILGPTTLGANSGSSVLTCIDLQTDGTMVQNIWAAATGCGSTWTASGVKTLSGGFTFTYTAAP